MYNPHTAFYIQQNAMENLESPDVSLLTVKLGQTAGSSPLGSHSDCTAASEVL